MANNDPFKKKKPGDSPAQTPEEIKQEIGGFDEGTNLSEPAPFLPDQPIPNKMAPPMEQQQQDELPPPPDFLNPQLQQQQQQEYAEPEYEQPAQAQPGDPFTASPEQQYEQAPQAPQAPQPAPGQYPPQAPPAQQHSIASTTVDGLRRELDTKIQLLNSEINNLKQLEANVANVTQTMSKMEQAYETISKKSSQLSEKTENEIQDLAATVDSMNATLSKALPALIKEIRSLKEPSFTRR